MNCGSTTFTLPINTPTRVLVSNWASCVAVISVGPFGRSLLSSPNKSFELSGCWEVPEAGLVLLEGRFVPGDLEAAAGAGEDFVTEPGFCCARALRKVAKHTMMPNRVTNFFTELLLLTFVAGLCLKFVSIINHQVHISDHPPLASF